MSSSTAIAPRSPAGTIPFGHGKVTQAALSDFHARERRLVAPLIAPAVPLDRR